MFCKTCELEEQKSNVYITSRTTEEGTQEEFYDLQGQYHDHDESVMVIKYKCSNGHSFDEHITNRCWCGWGWPNNTSFREEESRVSER